MVATYAIAAWADIDALSTADKDWLETQIGQTDLTAVRHSITAPDDVIVKWAGAANPLTAKAIAHTEHTHASILAEIHGNTHWETGDL